MYIKGQLYWENKMERKISCKIIGNTKGVQYIHKCIPSEETQIMEQKILKDVSQESFPEVKKNFNLQIGG